MVTLTGDQRYGDLLNAHSDGDSRTAWQAAIFYQGTRGWGLGKGGWKKKIIEMELFLKIISSRLFLQVSLYMWNLKY